MTDFGVPADFPIIDDDLNLGSTEIRAGKIIGGNVDEVDAIIKGARYAWAQGARQIIAAKHSGGGPTPELLFTTTSTSYVEAFTVPIKVALGRLVYTITAQTEQGVLKAELFTSGAVSRGSVEMNSGTGETTINVRDMTLTDSTGDSAYLTLSLKAHTGPTTANLYGWRVLEDASTL